MFKPVKVAMIGCGSISGIYLQNITNVFKELELVGVCDLIRERAERRRLPTTSPSSMRRCTTPLPTRRSRWS